MQTPSVSPVAALSHNDDSAMSDTGLTLPAEEMELFIAHKLSASAGVARLMCMQKKRAADEYVVSSSRLTSSLAVYPPLPLASSELHSSTGHVSHVLLSKGRWTEHTGHRGPGGRLYLQVEEMTWLLEQGVLEVMHEDMPLSIEEAYSLLLDTTVPHSLAHPSSAYAVYNTLRNGGYVLMRLQQFSQLHTPARVSASASASRARSSDSTAALYSVTSFPPPQAKKQSRRDAQRKASTLSAEQLQQERDRLLEMQSLIPCYDAATVTGRSHAAASVPVGGIPAAASVAAASSSTATPASSSADSIPLLPSSLFSLLSLPCDVYCVWLPGGGAVNAQESHNTSAAASFRKSSPGLPDFLCIATNPWLTFEQMWEGRRLCTRAVSSAFQQKRHAEATFSSRKAGRPPCFGDALELMYTLSAERSAVAPSGHALELMPLRLAHVPLHQQRVLFLDWPSLPAPSCIELQHHATRQAQHAQAFQKASGLSIFQH
jgi:hypothetical protein